MARRKGISTGTTAQRTIEEQGHMRFNSTTNLMEYYDGTNWKSIDSPPTVTSIDVTSVDSAAGGNQTFVITGSNFATGPIVTFVATSGSDITVTSGNTTLDSSTQITAVVAKSSFANANEPYSVKVTNPSGLSFTLADQVNVQSAPVFGVAAGSLGTLADANRAASNLTAVTATDADSESLTFSITSGSVPSGLTFNSNGTWSGTATQNTTGADVTSSFTVSVTDGTDTVTRNYSITVKAAIQTQMLIVAGGGGGGTSGGEGGGGGAGGLLYYGTDSSPKTPNGGLVTLTPSQTYTVTVGAGGSGSTNYDKNGTNGGDSSVTGSGISLTTAVGGGEGGAYPDNCGTCGVGENGGSGGGGGGNAALGGAKQGGSGTSGQGNDGGDGGISGNQYAGAGGGGAGAAGGNGSGSPFVGGSGGNGLSYSITGSSTAYAGGGGGNTNGGTDGQGGSGGGGGGPDYSPHTGTANTGGGGGANSANGGSGVVIIRLPTALYTGTTSGSPTVTTTGSDTVIKFTGSGSYTA